MRKSEIVHVSSKKKKILLLLLLLDFLNFGESVEKWINQVALLVTDSTYDILKYYFPQHVHDTPCPVLRPIYLQLSHSDSGLSSSLSLYSS